MLRSYWKHPGGHVRPQEVSLALALLVVFAPALASLAAVWRSVDHYSHGFLVPLVSLWVAWTGRARLAGLAATHDRGGLALLALALGLYAVGMGLGETSLQGLALVGAVAGGVRFLRGPAALGALGFPVAFLLFMVPLPASWLTPLVLGLQQFVTWAAVGALRVGGMAVAREGNVITLPDGGSLFVAEACSGVTSIVTLLPLGVLFAWFTERSWMRRGLLVASVVPVALVANLVRVVATAVAARHYGVEAATEASLHELAGLLTYVLGCVVLVGLGALLRRAPR